MAQYDETVYVRTDKATKEAIAQAAGDLGMSQAEFVRSAIAQALAEYRDYLLIEGKRSRAPVAGGQVLPISEESAIAIGVVE